MTREKIIVLTGPNKGKEIEIGGSLSIGRSPVSDLQISDLMISRHHAKILQTPSGTIIRDLGSSNGTYLGDQLITECRLSHGDVVKLGSIQLRYELEETLEDAAHLPPQGVRFEDDDDGLNTVAIAPAKDLYENFIQAPRELTDACQLRDAQDRLAAVYEANQVISSERDLKKIFGQVMEQIFSLLPAHNGVILLRDDSSGELVTEYVRTATGQKEVKVSTTIVQLANDEAEAVITSNTNIDQRFDATESIIGQNITSAMCTPLRHQDETLGVLYVDTRGTTHAFTQSDLELLVALAGPASIAIKNAQYVARLEQAYQDTLVAVANAIELRDHYTVGHAWRVTNFAVEMARVLGWSEEKLKECEMGGALHDVGKIGVDDAILHKPGRLDDEEYDRMKVHPERGARMLRDSTFLVSLVPYALYHHERYDGKGYPFGLAGEQIPIEGRLMAVADAFDAMTSSRPYRGSLEPKIAIAEIEGGKGTQFDPMCADALVQSYRKGKITWILQEHYKNSESVVCPFCSTYILIPAGADRDAEFECGVCHRRIRLRWQNDTYFGELVVGTE